MLIDITTAPPEIQQYLTKVEQGESISFTKNGKVIASINPPVKSLIERFSQSNPAVADIDFELPPRQMPSKASLEIFD